MAGIWVPPSVPDSYREETLRREAHAAEGLDRPDWEWVQQFNRDLEAVMPGMRLLWCPDPAPLDAVAMGARPGRWAILIPGQFGGPASAKPIVGPDDSFVDPSLNASAIFENLRRQDWWNPQVRHERERAQREADRVAERRKEQEREEKTQDVLEHYLAATRAQVSMNRDVAWSQNAAGRKGAKPKEQ